MRRATDAWSREPLTGRDRYHRGLEPAIELHATCTSNFVGLVALRHAPLSPAPHTTHHSPRLVQSWTIPTTCRLQLYRMDEKERSSFSQRKRLTMLKPAQQSTPERRRRQTGHASRSTHNGPWKVVMSRDAFGTRVTSTRRIADMQNPLTLCLRELALHAHSRCEFCHNSVTMRVKA